MSKEKKNRFYYSKKQNEIYEEIWNIPTRFTFVKTPDGWKQYSEWCSVKGIKCNWEDAELVYETDDIPEIVIHEGIPEFINELETKLAESEARAERYKNWHNEKAGECAELKQQLADKEKEISNLKGLVNERDKQIKNLKTNKKRVVEHKNKVKIDYAVEQLEKVKKHLTQELEYVTELLDPLEYEDYHEFIGCGRGYKNSIEEIDNQIKVLKEGK